MSDLGYNAQKGEAIRKAGGFSQGSSSNRSRPSGGTQLLQSAPDIKSAVSAAEAALGKDASPAAKASYAFALTYEDNPTSGDKKGQDAFYQALLDHYKVKDSDVPSPDYSSDQLPSESIIGNYASSKIKDAYWAKKASESQKPMTDYSKSQAQAENIDVQALDTWAQKNLNYSQREIFNSLTPAEKVKYQKGSNNQYTSPGGTYSSSLLGG